MSAPVHHLLDVYDTHLHLATTRRAWATLKRRHPGLADMPAPDSAGLCRIATFHPKAGLTQFHVVLWINTAQHEDQSAELLDTCAHEATHAALSIVDYIGHDPRGTNDEPLAYLVGWITRWIWTNLQA